MNLNLLEEKIKETAKNNFSNISATEKDVKYVLDTLSKQKDTITFDGYLMKNDREFNKNLVKCYRKLCEIAIEKTSDYNFLRPDFYIEIPGLEEILLNLMFNKTLSDQDIIKYIKGLDYNLNSILYLEKIVSNFYTVEYMKTNTIYENEELIKLSIILDTLVLIKAIKFGLSKYDIDYFDNNLKPKKIYTGYKIVSGDTGLMFLLNRNIASYKNIVNYIKDTNNNSYTTNTISDSYNRYDLILDKALDFMISIGNSSVLFPVDYLKLLLKEDFKSILNVNNIAYDNEMPVGFSDSKVFYNRKVLMPKSGVVLLIKNHPLLESILIKEISLIDGNNNIVFIGKFKDGTEIPNVIVLQNTLGERSPQIIVDYYKNNDIRIVNYIYHFLGISIDDFDDCTLEYDIISPVYWKYRDKNYTSQNDTIRDGVVVKREFQVEIAPFLRKINGEASEEAKALAKKLCINLDKGFTIVKPHTRTYNKIK